jgi:hypothetical protein
MSNVFTTLGTVLSVVAGKPASPDEAGYDALTYAAVGEVGDLGEFGGTREVPTFTPVDTGVVAKRAGSVNYGTQTLQIARDASDVGQIALKEGFDGTEAGNVHSVKLEDRNGNIIYYQAIISSFTYNASSADTIFGGSIALAITSKPLPVAAT